MSKRSDELYLGSLRAYEKVARISRDVHNYEIKIDILWETAVKRLPTSSPPLRQSISVSD